MWGHGGARTFEGMTCIVTRSTVERFCGGRRATIVETARRDLLRGTRRADVIATLGGNDRVDGLRGNDVVCGGRTGIASWAAAAETHWSAAPVATPASEAAAATTSVPEPTTKERR